MTAPLKRVYAVEVPRYGYAVLGKVGTVSSVIGTACLSSSRGDAGDHAAALHRLGFAEARVVPIDLVPVEEERDGE